MTYGSFPKELVLNFARWLSPFYKLSSKWDIWTKQQNSACISIVFLIQKLNQTSASKQKFGHQVCLYFAKVNNPACMDFLQTGEVNGDAKVWEWMWRTCVSAAGVVCRDRWGEEFRNQVAFQFVGGHSVFIDVCLYKLNFKICQNNIEAARSWVHLLQSEQLHSKALCLLSLHSNPDEFPLCLGAFNCK